MVTRFINYSERSWILAETVDRDEHLNSQSADSDFQKQAYAVNCWTSLHFAQLLI